MWSAIAYIDEVQLYFPLPRGGSISLAENRVLPIYLRENRNVAHAFVRSNIRSAFCYEMSALTSKRIEKICMHCKHAIECSLSRKHGDFEFSAEKGIDVSWQTKDLTGTLEIPFLCLIENLEQHFEQDIGFELRTITEFNTATFNRDRISMNLDFLLKEDASKILRSYSMRYYARFVKITANSTRYEERLMQKLQKLKTIMLGITQEQFDFLLDDPFRKLETKP